MKEQQQTETRRPYVKPTVEVIEMDTEISLVMVSPPPLPPSAPPQPEPDKSDPSPIWD